MAFSQSSPSTSSTTTTASTTSQIPTVSATRATSTSPQHQYHQHPFASTPSTPTNPRKETTTDHIAPTLSDAATTRSSLNETLSRSPSNFKHRQSTLSISSTKQNRTGLLTLAALARDKTTNAIANFSEPTIRSRTSSRSLYRSAQSSPTISSNKSHSPLRSASSSRENNLSVSQSTLSRTEPVPSDLTRRQSLLETNPPSQAYNDTAADTPPPIAFVPRGNYNKMHQTSSRLLRMTSDDRPFTRVSTG
jgi:hypothetical protein